MDGGDAPGRSRQRHSKSRGAVAVEYALGAALVFVASIGAIGALQDTATSNLATHGASAGAPDLPDAGIPATTSTTTPPPTTSPPTTAPPSVTAQTSITGDEGVRGNHWSPKVDVTVTDSSGNVLTGAVIQVTWTGLPTGPYTQTCTVVSTGVCSFQLNRLENRASQPGFVDSVTATVTSVTGTNPTLVYTPGGTTLTLNPVNR